MALLGTMKGTHCDIFLKVICIEITIQVRSKNTNGTSRQSNYFSKPGSQIRLVHKQMHSRAMLLLYADSKGSHDFVP